MKSVKRPSRRTPPATPPAPRPDPPLATALVAACAAVCVLLSVSNRIGDYDVWEHLAVGRSFWELGRVPQVYLYTWPSYGQPAVIPSWLFRALLWPVWETGGVLGLFLWRWATTLAAFGLLYATARRLGTRGFVAFVPFVLASLIYRQRSEVRPETLVSVLLALTLWILEQRRAGGPDRTLALVPLAWIWANAHVSYHLGLLLIAVYALEDLLADRRRDRNVAHWQRDPRRLALVGLAALAVSFAGPFGWRALAVPFQYFLFWRHEPLFRSIEELRPIDWSGNLRNGVPLMLVGWPALALMRALRHGVDRVELALLVCFTAFGFVAQRFLGFYALVAAPYVARDLSSWVAGFAARRPVEAGSRAGGIVWRAAGAIAACVAIGWLEWNDPRMPLGVAMDWNVYPVSAAEFMAREGVAGRGYTSFHLGGFLIHRFWPDRGRLPFMDAHQEVSSQRDRDLYHGALIDRDGWLALDRVHRFDYALVGRARLDAHRVPDVLDADSTWALVHLEDAAALYVRRDGPLHEVARRSGYRWLPGGLARLEELRRACWEDSVACEEIERELERAASGSAGNAHAHILLANVNLLRGRFGAARAHLETTLAVGPLMVGAHERLGRIALAEGDPAAALRELRAERRLRRGKKGLDFLFGQAHAMAGDRRRARASYQRELARDPSNQAARDSLATLAP